MRKKQILDAATDIFAKDGYEQANTDDIASIANLGKGTLYRYFKNKETLFLSVVKRNLQIVAESASTAINTSSDPIEQIEYFVKGFLSFFDKNPKFCRIMIQVHEQSNLHKRIAKIMFDHYRSEMKKFEEIFKNGVKAGMLKQVDSEKATSILMSILSGILHMHIFYKKKQKLICNAHTVFKVFFTGIIEDKSRRIKYE
jgi:AcrR family transcriptional regulator